MDLHSFSKHKPCYFCGKEPPSSKEHIPPKVFFRHDTNNSLTVPSCAIHNSKKTLIDQAMLYFFLKTYEWGIKNTDRSFDPILKKIYYKERENFPHTKKILEAKSFLTDPLPGIDNSLPHINFNPANWLIMIASGLLWKLTGLHDPNIKWMTDQVYFPNFYGEGYSVDDYLQEIHVRYYHSQELESLNWVTGWATTYPEKIFLFNLAYLGERKFIFHNRYFNTYDSYVIFVASKSAQKILNRVISDRKNITFSL